MWTGRLRNRRRERNDLEEPLLASGEDSDKEEPVQDADEEQIIA